MAYATVNYKPAVRGHRGGGPLVNISANRTDALRKRARKLADDYKKATGRNGVFVVVNRDALNWVIVKAEENLNESMKANQRPINFRSKRLERAIRNKDSHTVTASYFRFMVRSKVIRKVPYYAAVEYGSYASVGRIIPFLVLGPLSPTAARKAGASPPFNRRNTTSLSSSAGGRQFRHKQEPYSGRSNQRDVKTGLVRLGIPAREAGTSGANGQFVTDRIIGKSEYRRKRFKGKQFQPNLLDRKAKGRQFVRVTRPVPEYAYGRKAGASFISGRIYQGLLKGREAELKRLTGMTVKVK